MSPGPSWSKPHPERKAKDRPTSSAITSSKRATRSSKGIPAQQSLAHPPILVMPSRDAEPDDAGSVRSGNLSGIIAGDFLVASQHPSSMQREDAPLLADSSSTSMIQPHISSMGNASGYGAIRPSSTLAQSISPDSHLRSELYTLSLIHI